MACYTHLSLEAGRNNHLPYPTWDNNSGTEKRKHYPELSRCSLITDLVDFLYSVCSTRRLPWRIEWILFKPEFSKQLLHKQQLYLDYHSTAWPNYQTNLLQLHFGAKPKLSVYWRAGRCQSFYHSCCLGWWRSRISDMWTRTSCSSVLCRKYHPSEASISCPWLPRI